MVAIRKSRCTKSRPVWWVDIEQPDETWRETRRTRTPIRTPESNETRTLKPGSGRADVSRHHHVETIGNRTYGHTKSGRPVDDVLIERLADEAEIGYDVTESSPPTRWSALT